MNDLPTRPTYTYTEDDWVQIRAHFMSSILVDIHLHKLAQNIGASWPIKGPEETPAKYLEYSFDELADAPGLAGQPPRLQLLLEILKETAAFDDPFQEMSEGKPDPERDERNIDQILERLGIPSDFPVEFTRLSAEAKALCQAEDAIRLGQAIALFQRMAQQVHLSGEIRQFLNGLAHTDEHGIAQFLPFRPGSRNLHLPEAIRNLILDFSDSNDGTFLSPDLSDSEKTKLEQRLLLQFPALLEWFPEDAVVLKEKAESNDSLRRYFLVLADPTIENAAVRLVRQYFGHAGNSQENQKCFLKRMMAFFRRN